MFPRSFHCVPALGKYSFSVFGRVLILCWASAFLIFNSWYMLYSWIHAAWMLFWCLIYDTCASIFLILDTWYASIFYYYYMLCEYNPNTWHAITWHLTPDTWYLTHDIWYLILDMLSLDTWHLYIITFYGTWHWYHVHSWDYTPVSCMFLLLLYHF